MGVFSRGVTGKVILLGSDIFSLSLPPLLHARPLPFKNADHPRLIETGELAGFTDHPSVRIIDMRTSLLDYLKGHIPDAVYLSYKSFKFPGTASPPRPLIGSTIEKTMGEFLSVSNDMWVVLYSEKSNPNATYLAWTLDYLGYKKVLLLNGGWEKWTSEKLPTTQAYPLLSPKKFLGKPSGMRWPKRNGSRIG